MDRVIKVKIRTNETGKHCAPNCRFVVGDWCDAFVVSLARVEKSSVRLRCSECVNSDITEVRNA